MYNKGDLVEYIRNAPGYDNDGLITGELGVIIKNVQQVEDELGSPNKNEAIQVVFLKSPEKPRYMYPNEIKKVSYFCQQ